MKTSFRKRLSQATKSRHEAIEEVFGFKNGLTVESLGLFLRTMLIARTYYGPFLANLEANFTIDTYNTVLIKALRRDIDEMDLDFNVEVVKARSARSAIDDSSDQLGIFYVFAGSSAGAKTLLSMAREQAIPLPLYYFKAITGVSKNPMKTFTEIVAQGHFDESRVIASARQTFDFILQTASNGTRKRAETV